MKFIIALISILFIGSSISLSAQSPELLKAEGKIPKEFITPSTVKFKKQVEALSNGKQDKKNQKTKKQFLLESNFGIDDILQSGLVLFNDPATVYINKVLSQLPIEDAKLKRKAPQAYILNSSAVNAFATDQGIIFVTLGLLANLQNEAQLAFILSHELMHVKHQHAINKFVQSKDIDQKSSRQEKNMGQVGMDKNLFKKSMYSQKLEEEADEDGLKLFLNSGYDPMVIINTFKILHYSYLPFEDYPFEKSFFEDEYFIFPEKLWLAEVNKISPMEENKEESETSSHPSSLTRLKKLEASVSNADNTGKKAFILPEQEFHTIQSRARYQIPFLNLYAENFPEAIYTSYLMLKEFPNDLELQKVIGQSLYMELKYRNYYKEDREEIKKKRDELVEKQEGSVHQLYHLLNELDLSELAVLALKYNWRLYQLHPEEEELNLLIDDLFTEFADIFKNLDDFAIVVKTTETRITSDSTKEELSKLDKIEQTNQAANFWETALIDELGEADFKEHYTKGATEVSELKEREDYYESEEGRNEFAKQKKKEAKKGKKLGINKIVVVNPFYLSLDERKDGGIQYIRSEEKQDYFRQTIKELAKTSKINATLLDVTDLSTNDIDKFNDIAEVNHYFSQQMDHYDLSLTPGYNQSEVNAIAEKYGTEYFLWTGVIALREKNNGWGYVVTSILAPYVLPITIINAVTPRYDMLYYAILFDIETGRRSILKMDYFNKRDSQSILNAHVYDVFQQIKNKEK